MSPFPFGIVAPGRPIVSDFTLVSQTRAVCILEDPKNVTELAFFQTGPIPEGFGAALHFSVPPFTSWEIIGAIGPGKPSGIFRTGFRVREDVFSHPAVELGISLEPLSALENLEISAAGVEDRISTANKIAMDLFNYMSSFCKDSTGDTLVVPKNVFSEWMHRFERKSAIDANFFQKS